MSRRNDGTENGKARRTAASRVKNGWQGFVELPLSRVDKERLAALGDEDYPDVGTFLLEVLDDGYKVSFVKDERHSCVIATLTGKGDGCVNAGYSLSGRGPDLPGAILVLHFKHLVICESGIWVQHADARDNVADKWG
jgi:hypothetical protein